MLRLGRLAYMMGALATSAMLFGCGGDGAAGPAGPAGTRGNDGAPGAEGPAGEDGLNEPTVNAITPNVVYLDRRVEVSIAGNDTHWTDSATVDFGPNITVDGVIAASSASLIVAITIEEGAEVGTRDVTVTDADGAVTYEGAFLVAPPLFVPGYAGSLAQGSIFIGRAELLDLKTPFDTIGAASGYPYLTATGAAGVGIEIQDATPFAFDFLALVDVTAATGDSDMRVVSGLTGGETSSLAPKALPIAMRSPTPIVEGMPIVGTVSKALESQLYSFAPGPNKLVTISATSQSPAAAPAFALLPSSGSFADLVSYGPNGTIVTTSADPIYVVYWDNSGAASYDFEINVETKDSDDKEPNDACDKAQVVGALPASLKNLSLASEKDEDWFVIDAGAADVGSLVHVLTSAGDANTDTFVDVFSGSCQNLTSLGGPSGDADYHEDFTSKGIPAAGKIYIKVSQSPAFPFAGSLYNLDIELAQTETEPNDTCATGNAIASLPAQLGGVSLASGTDEDWFTINVAAADVGKLLKLQTTPGAPNTDTYIEVFDGNCAALNSFATSSDADYHESLLTAPLPAAGTYFVKVSQSPSYPYAGADYNLSVALIDAADKEPNDTCAMAQPATLPASIAPLFLSSATDEDWLTFTAAAGDVGKTVHVVTSPGEANTDTLVEVFEGSCAGLTSLGLSSDANYHEDLVSAPITAAGPIYVKVSVSTLGSPGSEYKLSIGLE